MALRRCILPFLLRRGIIGRARLESHVRRGQATAAAGRRLRTFPSANLPNLEEEFPSRAQLHLRQPISDLHKRMHFPHMYSIPVSLPKKGGSVGGHSGPALSPKKISFSTPLPIKTDRAYTSRCTYSTHGAPEGGGIGAQNTPKEGKILRFNSSPPPPSTFFERLALIPHGRR